MSICSASVTPVVCWKACKADSKRAENRVEVGWSAISQLGRNVKREQEREGPFAVRKMMAGGCVWVDDSWGENQ